MSFLEVEGDDEADEFSAFDEKTRSLKLHLFIPPLKTLNLMIVGHGGSKGALVVAANVAIPVAIPFDDFYFCVERFELLTGHCQAGLLNGVSAQPVFLSCPALIKCSALSQDDGLFFF